MQLVQLQLPGQRQPGEQAGELGLGQGGVLGGGEDLVLDEELRGQQGRHDVVLVCQQQQLRRRRLQDEVARD